ncbi:MAG: DUF1223 domain-containing protein, partial [Chthoniobacteraceae bacterium]
FDAALRPSPNRRMKLTVAVAAMLLAAAPLFAAPITFESAETPVTLIELFTSEGCSSCPPADAWVSKLKANADLWKSIVPVVFHVDYWNGLGWPDRFATRGNTERQHRYAAAWRSSSVYTPGFVLNGREWRDWNGRAPQPAAGAAKVGKLRVTLPDGAHADVTFTPIGNPPKPLQVELALLGGDLESDVKRGENSGRKLRHDFVVLHLATAVLTSSDGRYTASLPLPEKTTDTPIALAAWVNGGDARPPIQVVGGWLKNPETSP